MSEKFSGFACPMDGAGCQSLTEIDAKAIWEECERKTQKRAVDIPTERDAIEAMFQAYLRLKELGWADAIYCPKDGSSFDVIEPGSTGIHKCHYEGGWPKGSWWVHDSGDLWPSSPILYRKKPKEVT